ncbi:MAG: hypothetical protein IJB34_03570 [Clostridia bacterium]|nr:hypothetical protein [Clostridia bacterium]
MKGKFFTKAKIITLIVILCVAVIIATGGTLAYFTDSKEMTSVYTSGNVYIELTESAVKADATGNLVQDTEKDRIVGGALDGAPVNDYGVIFPGQTIYKDPTIKNIGMGKAWIAAKVIITDGAGDLHNIFGYSNNDGIDITCFLEGGLLAESIHIRDWNGTSNALVGTDFAMVQLADRANGRYEFFFFMLAEVDSGEHVTVFDTMFIDPLISGEEMQEFVQLTLTVQAFAVQTYGFDDCYTAMRVAFGDHFGNLPSNNGN